MSRIANCAIPGWPAAEAFLTGCPLALEVLGLACAATSDRPGLSLRTNRSYVTLAMRRGFGYVWLPGKWLRKPATDVVLSFALGHEAGSPRFKSIVQVAPGRWLHHLEVTSIDQLDAEVTAWLRDAQDLAAGPAQRESSPVSR